MVNLKNITELPVAESAEGLNLIVNDNGAAKQIAASAVGAQADWSVEDTTSSAYILNKPEVVQSDWAVADPTDPAFIKNKPTKELMYEWNFSTADSVYDVVENVDYDLSVLTQRHDDFDIETVVEMYYCKNDYDAETDQWSDWYPIEGSFGTAVSNNYVYGTNIKMPDGTHAKNVAIVELWSDLLYGYEHIVDDTGEYEERCEINVWIEFDNGIHYDVESGVGNAVENGGSIALWANGSSPFKSIKIYKVAR